MDIVGCSSATTRPLSTMLQRAAVTCHCPLAAIIVISLATFLTRNCSLAAFVTTPRSSSALSSIILCAQQQQSPRLVIPTIMAMTSKEDTCCSTAPFPISKQIQETLDPCVVLMKQMIAEYQHLWNDKGGVYSLAQGVVYWEPPATVYEALLQAIQDDPSSQQVLHTYCPDEGLPELRHALLQKCACENSLHHVDVMVTAGANQAFVNCVVTLLSHGDKCVVFQPYYFNHVMAIQMTHGNSGLVVGPCTDEGIPDVDWLDKALQQDDHIRMVTIVNPGNPTGVSMERTVLQTIVDICGKHGVWCILDCTYEHFDHSGANTVDGSSPFPGFNDEHVIYIFSFSKGHALAGFRCGYVVISQEGDLGKEAYQQMLKVRTQTYVEMIFEFVPNNYSNNPYSLGSRYNSNLSFANITNCSFGCLEGGTLVGVGASGHS